MKIALLLPPEKGRIISLKPTFPLGIGYIKALCERNRIHCDLFDFSATELTTEKLIMKYDLKAYDIIGISSYSLIFDQTALFIDQLKDRNNIIIVGGHHASLAGDKILKDFPKVDFAIRGLGEYSFLFFVINFGTSRMYKTPGLIYRDNHNIIKENSTYNVKFDLDKIPFGNREDIIYDFNNKKLIDVSQKVLTICSSRGCPYNCSYCVNCKSNYWLARSVENVLAECKLEFGKLKYRCVSFIDDNFFVNPLRAKRIIEELRKLYPNIEISFQTRSDQIVNNKTTIIELANSGKLHISLGIESNSNEVLKRYNKQTDNKINQKAIDILRSCNIDISVFIIMFEALESLRDIRISFDFLKNNNLCNYDTRENLYQTLIPFYGTTYYNKYHQFYEGSIHGKSVPKFVNSDVSSLYHAMCQFQNEYDVSLSSLVLSISEKEPNSGENRLDLFFFIHIEYAVFEYFLTMSEKFGVCSYDEFKKSKLCKLLDNKIKKYYRHINYN
ncbi:MULTISPECIES: B12-binding domain-containing radical SAM protein [unclassified Petrotoga]|uniref:B12-binding domain-containing radical SAM protein n=1 Tax=unclassified Petrotoga TaxID=2620614 RepID=UPI000F50E5C7|nr:MULTISPECIES: radical SAM protein [unclassified Petrotoga]